MTFTFLGGVFLEKNMMWCKIVVNDPLLVRVLKCPRQRLQQSGRFQGREWSAAQLLPEAASPAILQGKVRTALEVARREDLHEVGVAPTG
jgi:hypothetical protein